MKTGASPLLLPPPPLPSCRTIVTKKEVIPCLKMEKSFLNKSDSPQIENRDINCLQQNWKTLVTSDATDEKSWQMKNRSNRKMPAEDASSSRPQSHQTKRLQNSWHHLRGTNNSLPETMEMGCTPAVGDFLDTAWDHRVAREAKPKAEMQTCHLQAAVCGWDKSGGKRFQEG